MTPKVTWPGRSKWPDLKLRFSKFDIVPKAHQWSELFETHNVQYEHGCLQFVSFWFFISVTLGHVDFVTSPL